VTEEKSPSFSPLSLWQLAKNWPQKIKRHSWKSLVRSKNVGRSLRYSGSHGVSIQIQPPKGSTFPHEPSQQLRQLSQRNICFPQELVTPLKVIAWAWSNIQVMIYLQLESNGTFLCILILSSNKEPWNKMETPNKSTWQSHFLILPSVVGNFNFPTLRGNNPPVGPSDSQ